MGLLTTPAFFWAVGAMFWSLPLATLTFYVFPLQLRGKRNDVFGWTAFLVDLLGVKVRKSGNNELYRSGRCLYLANHRSWADFFTDAYLTEGRAQMMSRMAVMYAFPMFMVPVVLLRACIVFKRGSIADKEAFNAWLDRKLDESPMSGLLVYPEGHRSGASGSLPLKRGMLHYAHSRRLPVQIVMTAGKEAVMFEKTRHLGLGRTVVTSYSRPVHSADYPGDFEGFFKALQAEWDSQWEQVYNAHPADLPPLVIPPVTNLWEYPWDCKLTQAVFAYGGMALMVVVAALWLKALLWATGLLGTLGQQVVLALLAAWAVASFVAASRCPPLSPWSQQNQHLRRRDRKRAEAQAVAAASNQGQVGAAHHGGTPLANGKSD